MRPDHADSFAAHLAELALGTLSGRERAAMLEHVELCSRCQAELRDLARVADLSLEAAPRAEPPAGFDERVLARLAHEGRQRPC